MFFLVCCLFYSCGNKSKKIEELKNVDRLLILDFERQQDSQSFNINGFSDDDIKRLSLDIADVSKRISNIKVQSLEYSDQQKVEKFFKPQALATGKYKSYNNGRIELTLVFLAYPEKDILSRSQVSGNLHNIQKLKVDLSDAIIEAFGKKVNKKKQNTVVAGTTNNQAQLACTLGVVSFLKYDVSGYKDAIKYFNQATKLDQNYAQAYARLATTYTFYGYRLEQAGKNPGKMYNNICPNAKKAVKLSPELSIAHRAVARCFFVSNKQNKEIMNEINTAIKLNPNDGESYYARALINQNIVNALKDFETASKLSPINYAIYIDWGVALFNQNKYKEAIEKYKKAIDINPNDADAYSNWGLVLGRQKKYKETIKKYKKAVEINPNHANAYSNWGDLLLKQNKYEKAINKCKKAIEINPNHAIAYYNWGEALLKQNKYEKAINKCKKVVEITPNDADAYHNWGKALEAMGKPKEAKKKYKKAKQL
jgi:tetratricopeptide (TPR) repeat protein